MNNVRPAAPPILAINSARSFKCSCSGVGSGSPRRAVKQVVKVQELVDYQTRRTHHDAAVETLLAYGDNDVLAIAFEDL